MNERLQNGSPQIGKKTVENTLNKDYNLGAEIGTISPSCYGNRESIILMFVCYLDLRCRDSYIFHETEKKDTYTLPQNKNKIHHTSCRLETFGFSHCKIYNLHQQCEIKSKIRPQFYTCLIVFQKLLTQSDRSPLRGLGNFHYLYLT